MDETKSKKFGELEALVFYYGEPIAVKKAAKLLDLKEEECVSLVAEWSELLKNNPDRGLTLLRNGNEIQLVTKPDFQNIGKKIIEEEFREELSPASLETLAIVAYLGPLARSKIDYIRGVNSSFTLRSLLMRGLVDRNIEEGAPHVYHYYVSSDFLKHMGTTRVEELPEYEKYKDLLQKFEAEPVSSQQ